MHAFLNSCYSLVAGVELFSLKLFILFSINQLVEAFSMSVLIDVSGLYFELFPSAALTIPQNKQTYTNIHIYFYKND